MTFLAGWRLVLLVAPLALLAAYVVTQRSRQRIAVRFTDLELLDSVAPRRPGWQRHIAGALLLLGLAALTVGFARPAWATKVPRDRATVVLALDSSASMAADDVSPNRLEAAKAEARAFVQKLPSSLKVGLVSFASTAQVQVAPTTDRTTVVAAIDALQEGNGTATGDAIDLAVSAVKSLPRAAGGKAAPAVIVLMSDGAPTVASNGQPPGVAADTAAIAAKAANVPVDTIAFGTAAGTVQAQGRIIAVPSDPQAMARIASESGGKSFTAQTAGQLKSVYDQIGKAVGYEVHKHEMTVWFTLIGLVAAALAGAAALIWTQRLV
jgi:Ca-activated chloride channel family protein